MKYGHGLALCIPGQEIRVLHDFLHVEIATGLFGPTQRLKDAISMPTTVFHFVYFSLTVAIVFRVTIVPRHPKLMKGRLVITWTRCFKRLGRRA